MKFVFGDIVVVEENLIGVVVKCWIGNVENKEIINKKNNYEVYVRWFNKIKTYLEDDLERYLVRHKYLNEEELTYQYNAINNL